MVIDTLLSCESLSIRKDYESIEIGNGGNMLMVAASGTAVKVQ
jgi:uncharacterized protein YbjQ (UPF0145 family)